MWVTDRHDMTLDVKAALNLNTTNQPTNQTKILLFGEELTLTTNYEIVIFHGLKIT